MSALRPRPIPLSTSPVTATPARFLTNEEAAQFLRLSPRTLEKRRVNGGGPPFHKFGRRVVYALDDLEAWAKVRCFEHTTARQALAR